MVEVTIGSLGSRGEGVAEHNGARIYVPFALPAERVEIAFEGDRNVLQSVIEAGPDRIDPICGYFGICGGCQLQHLSRPLYEAFKRGLVEAPLRRLGIETPVGPLIDASGAGRRRTTLHARKSGAGFMRFHTHELLAIEGCPILVPALAKAPAIGRAIHAIAGDCDVSFTATLTGLDVAIRTEKPGRKPEKLVPLAQTLGLARLTLNRELVLEAHKPLIRMGKAEIELPPSSFLQATEAAEETLSRLVLEGVGGAKTVADLFCGIGPFALRLAERAKVFAADSDHSAIAALQKAVRMTQGLKPVTATFRDLFREPLVASELKAYDAVVFDPPRAGAEAQAQELAKSTVKTVVAVSCDPKTFARDAALLIAGGYRLGSVMPVDQFAYSTHIEVVGTFSR